MSKDYSMTCNICGRPTTRFEVLRVGGAVELVTGARFICPECCRTFMQAKRAQIVTLPPGAVLHNGYCLEIYANKAEG